MLRVNFRKICAMGTLVLIILAGFAITAWAQLAPPAREIPGSRCGSRFGDLELSGESRRYARQSAGTEYRSTGTALLPGGEVQSGRRR